MTNYEETVAHDYPPSLEALHQSLDFTPSNKLTFGLDAQQQAVDTQRESSRNQTIRNEILDIQVAATPTPKHTPPKVSKKMLGASVDTKKYFDFEAAKGPDMDKEVK